MEIGGAVTGFEAGRVGNWWVGDRVCQIGMGEELLPMAWEGNVFLVSCRVRIGWASVCALLCLVVVAIGSLGMGGQKAPRESDQRETIFADTSHKQITLFADTSQKRTPQQKRPKSFLFWSLNLI